MYMPSFYLFSPTKVYIAWPASDRVSHSMTPGMFTSQLTAMDDCSDRKGHFVPECLQEMVSPLKVCKWGCYIARHF